MVQLHQLLQRLTVQLFKQVFGAQQQLLLRKHILTLLAQARLFSVKLVVMVVLVVQVLVLVEARLIQVLVAVQLVEQVQRLLQQVHQPMAVTVVQLALQPAELLPQALLQVGVVVPHLGQTAHQVPVVQVV